MENGEAETGTTPPTIKAPIFHNQISPVTAIASTLPTVLTMRPEKPLARLAPAPTLPCAMRSALPATTMELLSPRPFRTEPMEAVMNAVASAPALTV